jgi:Ion channel
MEMLQTVLAALALVGFAVVIHYESLRAISIFTSKLTIPHRALSLVVISGVLLAHLAEICLFAAGFFIMHEYLGLGSVKGEFNGSLLDYFYFSATTYSTLGVGDLFPVGVIRLVAGVEALTGFVLIGWSASFTYLTMERSWDQTEPGPGEPGTGVPVSLSAETGSDATT